MASSIIGCSKFTTSAIMRWVIPRCRKTLSLYCKIYACNSRIQMDASSPWSFLSKTTRHFYRVHNFYAILAQHLSPLFQGHVINSFAILRPQIQRRSVIAHSIMAETSKKTISLDILTLYLLSMLEISATSPNSVFSKLFPVKHKANLCRHSLCRVLAGQARL